MRPAGRRPPTPPSLRRTHAGRRRGPPSRPPALRSDGPSVSQSLAFRPPCPVSGPAREQSRGSIRGITLGAWRVPHLPHRPGHGRRRATHVFQWPVCVSSSFVPRRRWACYCPVRGALDLGRHHQPLRQPPSEAEGHVGASAQHLSYLRPAQARERHGRRGLSPQSGSVWEPGQGGGLPLFSRAPAGAFEGPRAFRKAPVSFSRLDRQSQPLLGPYPTPTRAFGAITFPAPKRRGWHFHEHLGTSPDSVLVSLVCSKGPVPRAREHSEEHVCEIVHGLSTAHICARVHTHVHAYHTPCTQSSRCPDIRAPGPTA